MELDPAKWSLRAVGDPVPPALAFGGRCARAEVAGRPGLMTRTGHWVDLATGEWRARAAPPLHPLVAAGEVPNALWELGGRPAVVGGPACDDGGRCASVDVTGYSPGRDAWEGLGVLAVPRAYHEVVEVPLTFCDHFRPRKVPEKGKNESGSYATGGGRTSFHRPTLFAYILVQIGIGYLLTDLGI